MENQTKICPYCGKEILAAAKKCKHCGKWLEEETTNTQEKIQTKMCPYCGGEILSAAKKCKHCGKWLNEETTSIEEKPQTKKCPFCGEEILAIAKKCRFCCEWLNDDPNNSKVKTVVEANLNRNLSSKYNNNRTNHINNKLNKKMVLYTSISIGIFISLVVIILFAYFYVPNCNNKSITNKLYKHILVTNSDIQNLVLDLKSATILSKLDRGYSCSIDGNVDNTPVHFEYDYNKISFFDFNINAKPVLPNCYASQVKQLLKSLVQKSSLYNISKIGAEFITDNETIEDFDKDKPCYKCKASINIKSKPGTAFVTDSWNIKNAQRDIKCNLDYKTYFCSNGFATCVELNDIYSCGYKKD